MRYWLLDNLLGLPEFVFQIGTGAVPGLVFIIVILWRKLWEKDNEVKAQNELILKDSKENVHLLTSFENTLNKLLEETSKNHGIAQQTLSDVTHTIIDKIDDIKSHYIETIKHIDSGSPKRKRP